MAEDFPTLAWSTCGIHRIAWEIGLSRIKRTIKQATGMPICCLVLGLRGPVGHHP